jgi:hypothetical protein
MNITEQTAHAPTLKNIGRIYIHGKDDAGNLKVSGSSAVPKCNAAIEFVTATVPPVGNLIYTCR